MSTYSKSDSYEAAISAVDARPDKLYDVTGVERDMLAYAEYDDETGEFLRFPSGNALEEILRNREMQQ